MLGEILLIIFSFLLALGGAMGIFFPFFPGVPLSWLGLLLFGYTTYFAVITWKIILIFLILVFATFGLDILAPMVGAKKYNASPYGLAGSVLGLFFGLAIFGPIGIIAGPFLGAFLGEIIFGKEPEGAFYSAKGTAIGFLAGSAIKLALVMVMFGYMIFALIF